MNGHLLIIDDELTVCKSCQKILTGAGYTVNMAMNGFRGLERVMEEYFDLVIVDLHMPDIDGMEVVDVIKRVRPETEVIIMTNYSTISSAVEGINRGAIDYFPKPFTPNELCRAVKNALRHTKLQAQNMNVPKDTGVFINKDAIVNVFANIAEDQEFVGKLLNVPSDRWKNGHHPLEHASNTTLSELPRFHSQSKAEHPGEQRICVCQGMACHVNGGNRIMEEVSKYLGIHTGETTPDGRFSLEQRPCFGSCALSPMVAINDRVYGKMTPQKLGQLLAKTQKYGGYIVC